MEPISVRGAITLPGDKSLSHRALMIAALAQGRSRLCNLSHGADIGATIGFLEKLGISVDVEQGGVVIESRGCRRLQSSCQDVDCGNSGTTLRLGLGILAGSELKCQVHGDASLNRRPVRRVIDPLNRMGGDLRTLNGADSPPVLVHGRPLHGTTYNSPVASAQVKSAVLLAGINAEGETCYREPVLSRDHTERFLAFVGADIRTEGTTVLLRPTQILSSFDYIIPGDISTATFYVVAALLAPGSDLAINDVLLNETRTGALDILRAMGGNISVENLRVQNGEPVGDLRVRESCLRGIDCSGIDTVRFIDEVPILSVAAMFASGTTRFRDIGELRVKESDRAQGIVDILASYGGNAILSGNDLIVDGGTTGRKGTPLHRGDHRLAMTIEIIELILNGRVGGEYHEFISISAPEFYDVLRSVVQ